MKKIKILGAGLAGLTAAINLAKEKYQVEVYEKNKDVGMRFHGDLQGLENWSEKTDILKDLEEMNLKINFKYYPFFKILLTNCTVDKNITSQKPFFYLVKRGPFPDSLDYSLKEQALNLGVKINFQKILSPPEVDLVATGPSLSKGFAVNKGIIFKTSHPDIAVSALNNKLAFKGYSYLLIAQGYGCMCTVVRDEFDKPNECFSNMREFFQKKFNLKIRSPKLVGGTATFSLGNFKTGDTLYAGEAAGLQDLLWGFGMRFAIGSGYLAARSIIRNENYEELAKKAFSAKLKASLVNRYFWEKAAPKDYSFLLTKTELFSRFLYSFHNYNLLQKMFYPIAKSYIKKNYPKLQT